MGPAMRAWPVVFLMVLPLAGCLDATGPGEGPDADPVAPDPGVPGTVGSMEFLGNAHEAATTGIWLHDDKAYLSGTGVGLRIIDITTPGEPVVLAEEVADVGNSRDVEVFVHPDGRTYAALSAGGVDLVDVTDPTAPVLVSSAGPASHNMAVVPGTAVVYNSRSVSAHVPAPGDTGQMDIIDFTDPADPVVTVFGFPAVIIDPMGKPRPVLSTTCHDITFNAGLQRAYCAGVTDTTIWDVSDPLEPVIIQVIDWPGTNIHHAAWDAHNGTMLVLGDEFGGVIASPPCSSTVRDPTSALWFFDISDLGNPVPVGYFQIEHDQVDQEDPGPWPYCSTHFGEVIEDRYIVMGWYSAGTVLIDFEDPANAKQVAHHYRAGTSTWEARYHKGHIYTGDTGLGMDVLRLVEVGA